MADTVGVTPRAAVPRASGFAPVLLVRVVIVVAILLAWETAAVSGLFYRDVVPRLEMVLLALAKVLTEGAFYWHLGVTALEVLTALVIGGGAGLVLGLVIGASRFLAKGFEPYLYYLGPTPKIIFFPILIMLFGLGPASKVAMGAVSCFFPVVLSVAAAMRQVDRVLVRVGKSFRASPWQMAVKVYMPAMRQPIVNGLRLGFGIALIGTLLAETKLSSRGIGFLIIQTYTAFDMPRMYAMLIVLFAIAIGANALLQRAARV